VTRFTSTSMEALSGQDLMAFRLLANIGVTSGSVYFCTGRQFLYFAGNTYTPVGGLGEVSAIEEESDGYPRDITMKLCGVNTFAATGSISLYEPLREDMFNRPVLFYRAFLDPQTLTMTTTPELVWRGRNESCEIKLDEGAYELRAVSALKKTAAIAYFNQESFRAVDSSDTFGAHIDQIPLFRSDWGGSPTYFNGKPTPYDPNRGSVWRYRNVLKGG
jgi:hypothetical protein